MIRRKVLQRPAYYTAETVAQALPRNFYLRLDTLLTEEDWVAMAAPLAVVFCPDTGYPVDPVVYLKIFLIGYLEHLTYDTDLAERIHDSLGIRTFLRYDLAEATPDHASISRVRAQVATAADIDAVLALVVARCAQAGLVDGRQVAVDSCLVPANASLESLVSCTTGQSAQAYLQDGAHQEPPVKRTVSNATFRSTTDPDARLVTKDGQPWDLYYRVTHVTDGRAQIILAARADEADTPETAAACPAVRTAAVRLYQQHQRPGLLVGDTGFDDGQFHRDASRAGFTPVTNYKVDTGGKPCGFQKADFTYDAAQDLYRCPQGHGLAYCCTEPRQHRHRYVSEATVCAACPARAACLAPTSSRRWLSRAFTEADRQRAGLRCHTPAGRAALRARKHIVEPPFGHLQTYGGMQLINTRGREKAHVKTVLAAVAWNLIRLVHCARPAPAPRVAGTMAAQPGRTPGVGSAKQR